MISELVLWIIVEAVEDRVLVGSWSPENNDIDNINTKYKNNDNLARLNYGQP